MTAEIIIMNRIGIALAADSAVTLGVEKIYTSADKLFLLAENAPVGIMVYGNADLIGIPWEIIIKLFRKKLGKKTFKKLEDYANKFVDFLRSDPMFTPTQQSQFVNDLALSYFLYFRDDYLRAKLDAELATKELSEADIQRIIKEAVMEEMVKTKGFDVADGLPKGFFSDLKSKYKEVIIKVREQMFQNFPIDKETNEDLINLICELLTRKRMGGFDSGVVIAGFGEDEFFPVLAELNIHGLAGNQPLYFVSRKESISENSIAYIAPFAQREMVHTFMEGIDPDLKELIINSTTTLFDGAADIIINAIKDNFTDAGESLDQNLRLKLGEIGKKLIASWDEKREAEYSGPIMEVVASLPKDELGAMAESLINLTKFKRRVSRQQETVGGPIDVAVITKGDGFVWIKRKHYFSPELNPRFLGKYYNK